MKITVEGQVYDFDPARMLNTEAIALQKVTGWRIKEWSDGLAQGDAVAMTALVWLIFRRNGQETRFDDVEFDMGSLSIEDDEAEPVPDPTPPPVEAEPEADPLPI